MKITYFLNALICKYILTLFFAKNKTASLPN